MKKIVKFILGSRNTVVDRFEYEVVAESEDTYFIKLAGASREHGAIPKSLVRSSKDTSPLPVNQRVIFILEEEKDILETVRGTLIRVKSKAIKDKEELVPKFEELQRQLKDLQATVSKLDDIIRACDEKLATYDKEG